MLKIYNLFYIRIYQLLSLIQYYPLELDPKIETFKEIPGANEYLPGDPLSNDTETFYDGTDLDQGNDQEQETFEMRLKKDIKVFDPKVPRAKNPNSRVVRRKPSSQGNTGGNTGNMGGQGTANGGKGHGAGTAGGLSLIHI